MPAQAPSSRLLEVMTQPVAAGSDATTIIGVVTENETVSSVSYIPVSNITGAATNNRTVSVVNKGTTAVGTTVVATLTYANTVNAVANDENDVTVSAVAGALDVNQDDVLIFTSVHVGTGIADPGGKVRVKLERR